MSQESPTKEELIASLQSTLEAGIKAGVPALSAAIRTSHGLLWQSSTGLSDVLAKTPISTTHIFGIGSISKVFVAVVIFQLVEETRLKLSDTVGEFLGADVTRGIANAASATVEQLLSHTGGVESWEDDPVWIREGRGKDLDPEKIWGRTETLEYIRRGDDFTGGPTPGIWSYANTNYQLLGLIIEEITGKRAEHEIRRRILDPLGMRNTYLDGFEEAQDERLPRRYHWATEAFKETAGICPVFSQPRDDIIDATGSNLSVEWVAGGMISSPTDLLSFAIALRDGKILSSLSLEAMKVWCPIKEGEMGRGIFRLEDAKIGGGWLGHNGSVLGFTGSLWWSEEKDCAVSVLANVGTMHAGDVPSSAPHVIFKSGFLKLALELAACE